MPEAVRFCCQNNTTRRDACSAPKNLIIREQATAKNRRQKFPQPTCRASENSAPNKGNNMRTKQSSNQRRRFPQPTCRTSENCYTTLESLSYKYICPMILVPTSQTQPRKSSTAVSHQYELSWFINSIVPKTLRFVYKHLWTSPEFLFPLKVYLLFPSHRTITYFQTSCPTEPN